MRRSVLVTTAVVMFAMGITAAVAQFQVSRPDMPDHVSYGAVKTGLYERMAEDPPNGPGSGDLSGFAIINVDPCDEILMVNVKLRHGDPQTAYDVYVKVNGAVTLVGTLMTNPVGIGTAQFYLDASMYAGPEGPGEIDVQVVVKPEGTSAIIGYATDTVTELFPDCDCDDEDPNDPNS